MAVVPADGLRHQRQRRVRKAAEPAGVPTQFVNDTAACRIFYTPSMYLSVSGVWSAVADVAWGDGGKLDERRCVSGSSTAEQQPASGSAKPTSSEGGRGAGAGAAGDSAAGVWGCGAAFDGFRGGVDISGWWWWNNRGCIYVGMAGFFALANQLGCI